MRPLLIHSRRSRLSEWRSQRDRELGGPDRLVGVVPGQVGPQQGQGDRRDQRRARRRSRPRGSCAQGAPKRGAQAVLPGGGFGRFDGSAGSHRRSIAARRARRLPACVRRSCGGHPPSRSGRSRVVSRIVHLFVREATRPLTGAVFVPSSKYHAHRALMLASLAHGTSRILGVVRRPPRALDDRGAARAGRGDRASSRTASWSTAARTRPAATTLSVGSSGTTLYFMIGLASLADAPVTLTGQKYFQRRPVGSAPGGARAAGRRADRRRAHAADHGPAAAPDAAAGRGSRGRSRSGSRACC